MQFRGSLEPSASQVFEDSVIHMRTKWTGVGLALSRIFSGPVLDHKFLGVGRAPRDANAVDLLYLREIHHHPLRMQFVILAGEVLRQIGIALPESLLIAIGHAREADIVCAVVAGEAAPRQTVPVGVANGFRGSGRPGEISAASRIAPRALRIPVPGFHGKLGVLTKSYWLPAG